MNAPALARYEIANALAKKAAVGSLSDDAMQEAWDVLDELPIVYHALRDGPGVVRSTLTLERRSAYDAAYLALADDLGAELWTLDGPLARNASTRDPGTTHRATWSYAPVCGPSCAAPMAPGAIGCSGSAR